MKRSRHIVLAIIASTSLTACGADNQTTQRDMYNTLNDCVEDWGSDDCEDDIDGSGHHLFVGPHYYYHGSKPYYYSKKKGGHALEALAVKRFAGGATASASPRASRTVASSISRGGFGGSGSSFGSGRS